MDRQLRIMSNVLRRESGGTQPIILGSPGKVVFDEVWVIAMIALVV